MSTSYRAHRECEALWQAMSDDWSDGAVMDIDLRDVLSGSSPWEARWELDRWRGHFPHAVTRLERQLAGWLPD